MDNLWAFLLQTLNASAVALLLLLLKTMLADKLSPRWQYGIWAVLAAALLLPANLLGRHGLLNLALWVSTVKPKFEQAFKQLCFNFVLGVHMDFAVDKGNISDISGVVGKHHFYSFRLSVCRLYNDLIGQ